MDALPQAVLSVWLGDVAPEHALSIGALLGVRLIFVVWIAPWFGPLRQTWLARLSVASLLLVTLLPIALRASVGVPPQGVVMLFAAAQEALFGATFSLLAGLPLIALSQAGRFADRAALDLSLPLDVVGPLSAFYRWLGWVLFVAVGGMELTLTSFADTLRAAPVGQLLAWSQLRGVALPIVALISAAIASGVLLALPPLLGSLLSDVARALLERFVPLWNTSLLWMPLRHVAALGLVFLSLSLIAAQLPDALLLSMSQARALMNGLTP